LGLIVNLARSKKVGDGGFPAAKTAHDEWPRSRICFIFSKSAAQMSGSVAEWWRIPIAVFVCVDQNWRACHSPFATACIAILTQPP
jgi:hypothetical protein